MTLTDLAARTPAEIDTEIARLESVFAAAQHKAETAQDTINRIHNASSHERSYPWNSQEKFEQAVADLNEATAAQAQAREALYPLCAEYRRRPWNRYYLVTNANGHVHSSTSCATCFITTSYAWLTEYSGMSHEDLVDLAGEKACTVCFPEAPVETLSRPTRLESAEVKARREERERKAAEKASAEVVVDGMIGWTNAPGTRHVYKTERGATNAIAGWLKDLAWYGTGHPMSAEWLNNVEKVREALAAKGVEYDYDKALDRARKAVRKDGGEPKY